MDSIFPMAEMINRYQRQQKQAPTQLGPGSEATRDALFQRFVRALREGDAVALRTTRLTEAEYAFLYFPSSIYARKPYEQPPALQWMLMNEGSIRAEGALLRKLPESAAQITGYTCPAEPSRAGSNLIWERCGVVFQTGAGAADTARLFGPIINTAGRFKFVSLTNDM